MKIDFNGQEMSIRFDKVPKLLYFNENGDGCGQIFFDGVRRTGIQEIEIKSRTNDDKVHPVQYRVQFLDKESGSHYQPKIISNMPEKMSPLYIGVKILDIEPFKQLIKLVNDIVENPEATEALKKMISNQIDDIILYDTIELHSEHGIYETIKTGRNQL